jgi:TnpA family transposase
MPVAFLSDEQAAAFGRFVGEPSRSELECFFFLDDADRTLVGRHRGEHNRLGFAVQLGTVRFLGTFLADPLEVPTSVLDYVAGQLDVVDPSVIKGYSEREATARVHAREIRRVYGFRDLGEELVGDLRAFVEARAWTHGEGPHALFDRATAWLRRRRVLLPGVTTLVRVVQQSREAAHARLYEHLAGAAEVVDPSMGSRLRGLLVVGAGERSSELERLRTSPTRTSGKEMDRALARVQAVRALGAGAVDVSGVPASRLQVLARYGIKAKSQRLRRLAEPRRTATLVAAVWSLESRAVDDALDLFDVLITRRVVNPSRRAVAEDRAKRMPELEKASTVLARVSRALAEVLDVDDENVVLDVEAVWVALEQVAPREQIAAAAAKVGELVPAEVGEQSELREQMSRRYRTVAPFLPLLGAALPLLATAEGTAVLAAAQGLGGMRQRRRVRREEVDTSLVSAGWQRLVFTGEGGQDVDRDAWVLCVLEQLRAALRRRDVFAEPSVRWADPRAQLLDSPRWDEVRAQALTGLGLDMPVDEHLADVTGSLDAAWLTLAEGLSATGGQGPVRVEVGEDDRARLSMDRLDALEVPTSLRELRRRVAGMLPEVDLPELLLEVHGWNGFLDAYTHLSGAGTRVKDLAVSVAALLVAEACNVGLRPVVSETTPALGRDRLGHVDQNYLRSETHAAANAILIEAQAAIPITHSWGDGLLVSVDGLRFTVPVRTINAGPNPKYFGRGNGLTWFNAVNDQVAGISAVVVPGTMRDSLHVLDTVLNLDGGPKPEMIASDTASYSDMVFGIFRLLGYRFSPRIADVSDARLWRANPPGQTPSDYGPLNDLARNKVDLDKIRRHWPEMLRVAGSLVTGAVRAYDLLRMLAREGRPTPLGAAITEYGRIAKTEHLLTMCDPVDETYRRSIGHQLTVQESRHRLVRAIFHGRRGQIYQRYRDDQEDQLGALGLVVNAVVVWNTTYIDAAVTALRTEGPEIPEANLARLSPLVDTHINMLGRYAFVAPSFDGLRPLRETDPVTL